MCEDNREVSESSDFESLLAGSTVIADRWIPQPRSHSGYLVYVIFTGPNAGVFYNWNTASSAHMGDDEVVYKGFPSIEEAHAAWDEYCMKKFLPPGLAAPARGSGTPTYCGSPSHQQVAESSCIPQHIPAVPCAYHSTARTLPPLYLSQNAAVRAHGHGSVSLPHQFDTTARTNAVRSQNHGSALSTNFYAVLTGLVPGVYSGHHAAEMALGPLAVATFERTGTQEEANEIFVARHMARAVAQFV